MPSGGCGRQCCRAWRATNHTSTNRLPTAANPAPHPPQRYYAAIPLSVFDKEEHCGKCIKVKGLEDDAPDGWTVVRAGGRRGAPRLEGAGDLLVLRLAAAAVLLLPSPPCLACGPPLLAFALPVSPVPLLQHPHLAALPRPPRPRRSRLWMRAPRARAATMWT